MGRHKTIEDEDLLAVAREVFVNQGPRASTRAIAERAGVSEAVIYQRYKTKTDLFFNAMSPPAIDIDAVLASVPDSKDLCACLEEIALKLLDYFRELVPVLLPLMNHPEFDYEEFVARHPDSSLSILRESMMQFLQSHADARRVRPGAHLGGGLALIGTIQSIAIFEVLGAHGGHIDDDMVRAAVRTIWTGIAPAS